MRRAWTAALPAGKYTARLVVTGAGHDALPARAAERRRARSAPPPPPASLASASTLFPVQGPYTFGGDGARFGAARTGHTHQGQDIVAAEGTPVVTPRGGTVHWIAYQAAGAGHYVVIAGDDGRHYVFMHLQAGSIARRQGRAGARRPADRHRSATPAPPTARTCTSRSGSTAGGPRRPRRRSTRSRSHGVGSIAPMSAIAPAFESGSLRLPHLGDCTHDGQPDSHGHSDTSR